MEYNTTQTTSAAHASAPSQAVKNHHRKQTAYGTPEQEREKVQAELLRSQIPTFSFSEYKKTFSEKAEYKLVRNSHNKKLRDAGFNPKKRMNLSESSCTVIW